jgi:hypothetical protein
MSARRSQLVGVQGCTLDLDGDTVEELQGRESMSKSLEKKPSSTRHVPCLLDPVMRRGGMHAQVLTIPNS